MECYMKKVFLVEFLNEGHDDPLSKKSKGQTASTESHNTVTTVQYSTTSIT